MEKGQRKRNNTKCKKKCKMVSKLHCFLNLRGKRDVDYIIKSFPNTRLEYNLKDKALKLGNKLNLLCTLKTEGKY